MFVAGVALMHLLALVYWLGADVGAFVASGHLTDMRQPAVARVTAARLIELIDMAPRTALILTAPTGLSLAAAKGWLAPAQAWAVASYAWIAALAWLALAWTIHLKHPPGGHWMRRADIGLRWLILGALLAAAASGGLGESRLALFIRLKLAILACAIAAGLLIRRLLSPMGAALGCIAASGATPRTDGVIATCMGRARIVVLCLWSLLAAAALLGLAKPA